MTDLTCRNCNTLLLPEIERRIEEENLTLTKFDCPTCGIRQYFVVIRPIMAERVIITDAYRILEKHRR